MKRLLPDSHTDFIFLRCSGRVWHRVLHGTGCHFRFIVIRGLSHAYRERMISTALLWLSGAANRHSSMINIGVNLELMPAKGMTLPLISYGGSSMIAICITAGFILALTLHRPEKRAQERSLFRISHGVPAE